MKLSEFASILNQTIPDPSPISEFRVDSREIQNGDVFFALPGEKADGHRFVQDAFQKGALACVVCRQKKAHLPVGYKYLFVDDVRLALQQAARKKAQKKSAQIICTVGSVGKTSTKFFLEKFLSPFFKVYTPPRSFNSQLTYPLSILNADDTCDFWLLEMGINQKGEMELLVDIAPPDFVIFTELKDTHVGNYKNFEELVVEKAKAFSHKQTKLMYMPSHLPFRQLLENSGTCEKRIIDIQLAKNALFAASCFEQSDIAHLPTHHIGNVILAMELVKHLGLSVDHAFAQLKHLKSSSGRFEKLQLHEATFINDSYNASAMLEAIEAFLTIEGSYKKRILFLGGVTEIGELTLQRHQEVLAKASQACDVLITLGKEFSQVLENSASLPFHHHFEDFDLAFEYFLSILEPGDLILLKGARPYRLERVIEKLTQLRGVYGR